jgi:CubicO group peptidase (beta-lactamase class C family)
MSMVETRRAEGLDLARLARIDQAFAGYVAEGVLPGAALLVARHGRTVHRATIGLKDIASGAPLAGDTIYRIFSMTKPVTAVAMMVLHERGLWSPEDPIAKHLPEFAEVKGPGAAPPAHAPTMRELMTHTAGFGYGIGPGPHDPTDAAYIAAQVWEADGLAEMSRRVASANHLPDAIIEKGVDAGFQKICRGRGYAFNGAVFYDPPAAGSPVGQGTYQWDGASGVWFWVDWANDLIFVGMIQRMMQEGMPRLQDLTQAWIAEALA